MAHNMVALDKYLFFCDHCFHSVCDAQIQGTAPPKLHFTACGGVFCRHCLSTRTAPCAICGPRCRTRPVDPSMGRSIGLYFARDILEMRDVSMAEAFRVNDWQWSRRNKLSKHLADELEEEERRNQESEKELRKLSHEFKLLEQELALLEQKQTSMEMNQPIYDITPKTSGPRSVRRALPSSRSNNSFQPFF